MSSPNSGETEDRNTYRKAMELRIAGNETACIAILLQLAESKTACWEVFDALANHAASNGETQLAMELFDMAVAREPVPGQASLGKAELLLRLGRPEDARLLTEHCLTHDTGNARARAMIERIDRPVDAGTPNRPRLIAYYLPQFHPIPENNLWWGKGFTEWTNVVRAKPLYSGHQQPRLPTDMGFYDLRLAETRSEQAALARRYGIHGFCYYYYWFADGRRLLERPLQDMLQSGEPDFPFCVCWANESWTRRWDGGEDLVLMRQDPSEANALAFIRSLVPLVADKRYIRIGMRPMILIYRVDMIPSVTRIASLWREEMRRQGVGEIYLVAVQTTIEVDPAQIGFDASCEFPPHQMPRTTYNDTQIFHEEFAGKIFDYREAVRTKEHESPHPYKRFPGVMTRWDNTPRRGRRAHIFANATPDWYGHWLKNALTESVQRHAPEERFVFINAWNEWAEGAYLEPDEDSAYALLETTRDTLLATRTDASPLEQHAGLSGDDPADDAAWNARSRSYPENIRFCVIVDGTSATPGQIASTLDSLAAQSYRGFKALLMTAPGTALGENRFAIVAVDSHAKLFDALKTDDAPWIVALNAGDLLTRRALHLFAEYAFTVPDAQAFSADAMPYSDTPWDARPLARGTVPETQLVAVLHSLLHAPSAVADTASLVRSIENAVPPKSYSNIPRLVALRRSTQPLPSQNTAMPKEWLPPGLPWKPLPRVVGFSGNWNDRRALRLAQPLSALHRAGRAECRIANRLPTPAALNAFGADVFYLHNPRPGRTLDTLAAVRRDTDLRCILSLDGEAERAADGTLHPALRDAARQCARVIVDGERLANELCGIHANVAIIPDALPEEWQELIPANSEDGRKLRVGWIANLLEPAPPPWLTQVITALAREIEWICIGVCPDELRNIVSEQREAWPIEDTPHRLAEARLDVALLPGNGHRANASDAACLLQLGASGCAVISAPLDPIWAALPVTVPENSAPAWIAAIRRHIAPDYRVPMAKALHRAVLQNGLITQREPHWTEALLRLADPHSAVVPAAPTDADILRRARVDIAAGQLQTGVAALVELADRGSPLWEIYDELGRYAVQTGDNSSAIELFRHALHLEPHADGVAHRLQQACEAGNQGKAP